jgi:hypothetical protein
MKWVTRERPKIDRIASALISPCGTYALRQRLVSRAVDFFALRVPCALVTVGFAGATSELFKYRTSGSAAQAVTSRLLRSCRRPAGSSQNEYHSP